VGDVPPQKDLPPRPNIKQAAEFHNVDDKTIRRRIADGSLIAYRIGPHLIRLDRDSVLNLGHRIGGAV
jgi:excisionase family DNA binding protein